MTTDKKILRTPAIIFDTAEAAAMARFYEAAFGGEVTSRDLSGVMMQVDGVYVCFRQVDEYRPPTWPLPEQQLQVHLDFYVDSVADDVTRLEALGAVKTEFQAHDPLLVVMRDPGGHIFCIGE